MTIEEIHKGKQMNKKQPSVYNKQDKAKITTFYSIVQIVHNILIEASLCSSGKFSTN